MKMKQILIIGFLVGVSLQLNAQAWNELKYEYYVGIGGTNLMGDVASPADDTRLVWVKMFNTVGYVANGGLKYKFADKQFASINLSLGQLYAEDPVGDANYYGDRGWKAATFFTEFSGRYEYMVFGERKRKTVYKMLGESGIKNFNLPTYLFIGIGGLYNIGRFEDVEGTTINTENYSNVALIIPFGVGFKTRLTNTSFLNVEVGLRFALTDGIDYANPETMNGTGDWYDQYQFITFNYVHKLRSTKKGYPNFRRR